MRIHLLCRLGVAIGLACAACDTDPFGADPCPSGICGSGPGSGSGSGSGGGAGCRESWTCSEWTQQSDGLYVRTCTDANMCGTADAKPAEGPVALPDLDMEYYKCNVEPVFDRLCAHQGCHGTEKARVFRIYARGRLRNKQTVAAVCPDGPSQQDLQDEGSGTVMCLGWTRHTAEEWQKNYDNSRSFMVGVTAGAESDLVRQPEIGAGFAHAGVHTWRAGDADHQTLAAWLDGAVLGGPCDPGAN